MPDQARPFLPAETIRLKRDGGSLSTARIDDFVHGLVDGRWGEGQVAALAMAIVWRGMGRDETVALTRAMTHSGEVLDWRDARLDGPVLDKHSTGGVGDKVSLLLAPMLAACGGVVPMVSGRGLGHTGGTLDKLESLPGYGVTPDAERLRAVLRACGCAIVGAGPRLAPADARLYAVRDLTATVESVALITASILSKKLAAGLQALVMDVKVGPGAFCRTLPEAQALARSLVEVAQGAGLPTTARITDMHQVLGRNAGNALEVQEALEALRHPQQADARLIAVTLALGAPLLVLGGLADDEAGARQALERTLQSGAAAERFAKMVAALGGPPDVLQHPKLPSAPVRRPARAARHGWVTAVDARALGLAVVALGGGRTRPGDGVDARVGLADVCGLGAEVSRDEPLALVHAADAESAQAAVAAVQAAFTLGDAPPAPRPLLYPAD